MANVSWDDLTPIDEQKPAKSVASPHQVSWADLTPLPTPPSFAQNLVGGIVNPIIRAANLIPQGIRSIEHKVGDEPSLEELGRERAHGTGGSVPQDIPMIPTQPGWATGIGNVISYLPVFGGLERAGARGAETVAPKVARWIRDIGTGAGAGAATGAITGTPGARGKEAIGGAIGGGVGTAFGKMLTGLVAPFKALGKFESTQRAFSEEHHARLPEDAHADMVNDIIDSYQNARHAVRPAYQSMWDELKGKGLKADDVSNLRQQIEKDKSNALMDLTKEHLPVNKAGDFDPEQFHHIKSDFFKASNMAKIRGQNRDAFQNKQYGLAMQKDLNDFLSKNGLKERYQDAQNMWKKTLLPYKESRAFKQILPQIDGGVRDLEGSPLSENDMDLFKNTAQTSKLANQFMPTPAVKDIGKFNELTNLLGGNKDLAQAHLKNMLLAKHSLAEGFDFPALVKDVEGIKGTPRKGLSQAQKDFIFPKREQAKIKELGSLKKPNISPWIKRQLTGVALGTALHSAIPVVGAPIGWMAGYGFEPVMEKGLGMAARSAPMRALGRSPISPAQVLGPLGAMSGAVIGKSAD